MIQLLRTCHWFEKSWFYWCHCLAHTSLGDCLSPCFDLSFFPEATLKSISELVGWLLIQTNYSNYLLFWDCVLIAGIYFSFSLSLLQNISYNKEIKGVESHPGFGPIFPLNNYSYLEYILEKNPDELLKHSLCWFIEMFYWKLCAGHLE